MKLIELLDDSYIITEAFSPYTLEKAMDEKRVISIYYDSPHDTTNNKGWRRIEPYVYGENKHGNAVLRAWQMGGASDTPNGSKEGDPLTKMPGWRMFRLDGIKNINIGGGDTIESPRPKYNPDDKDMSTIYKAIVFGDNGEITTVDKTKTPSTSEPTPRDVDNVEPTIEPRDREPVTPRTEPRQVPPKPSATIDKDDADLDGKLEGKPSWIQNMIRKLSRAVKRK